MLYPRAETFWVLRDKEMKAYGEHRTLQLVLEAWDRLEQSLPVRGGGGAVMFNDCK